MMAPSSQGKGPPKKLGAVQMCGAGHNLRLILARLQARYSALMALTPTFMYGLTLDGGRQERDAELAA
jgi:hypothetical protein